MEEYEDEDDPLDLGKLVSVLRSMPGKSPDPASSGPVPPGKKKVRWVKKKVRRRKKAEGDDVIPPPMRSNSSSAATSAVSSPAVARKEPGGGNGGGGGPLKKNPPPPPPPDYPYEDLSAPLTEKMKELSELVTKTQGLYDGFKAIDKALGVKIDALNQLVGMKTKM